MNHHPKEDNAVKNKNPETIISIEQDIISFQIQINNLKNKILESQRKLIALGKKGNLLNGCEFKDFPDE
jgi:hypothetical protein